MTADNYIVAPMIPAHLSKLIVHDYIGFIQDDLANPQYAEAICQNESYTLLNNGEVVGCYGATAVGTNRYHVWALLSDSSGKCMLRLTRHIKKLMDDAKLPRLETNVRCDFTNGIRWAEMLGFICETPKGMKNFGDDGYDYYLYSRCA